MIELPEELEERSFVAEEFLTWLWWQCETQGGIFEIPGGASINLAIEDHLVLRGDSEGDPEDVLRGGVPTRSQEAGAALASGKRLARAKLVLATGLREWTVTFDATTYKLMGAAVPKPEGDTDHDLEAFLGFEDLADAIDNLFGAYVAQRLSKTFESKTVPEMRKWVKGKM